MLENLHVKNLALIDETEVDFGPGLNILTGETGAGKSILLGSVNLAIGGKYSSDMLRNGAQNGIVELTFQVNDARLMKRLESMDISPEDGRIVLCRRLTGNRSVSRINGETVSTSVLKDVASLLIDIHGQHDNQTLLHKKNHLALLDQYAGEKIRSLKEQMVLVYRRFQEISREEEQSCIDEENRRRELSLAEYEVNEIEAASLSAGEDEELEKCYRRMSESRNLAEAISETYGFTSENTSANASDCISRAIRCFQNVAEFDDAGAQLYEQLLNADAILNDFNRELSEYAKSLEFSEEEFRETEDRLNQINHLKAKYGNSVKDILLYCEQKKQRIEELNHYDFYRKKLAENKNAAYVEMIKISKQLHEIRKTEAENFSRDIRKQMKELNFLDVRLEIRVTDSGRVSSVGSDEAEFYIAVNPGEPLKSLSEIASGGELSRIMLAIKTVLADEEDTPTQIFDEIDSGISGIAAGKVGEKLHLIGKSRQVICITHLPQIAASADNHFLIEKEAKDNSVHTKIRKLDYDGSIHELARILGGSKITDHILESAREMKETGKRER